MKPIYIITIVVVFIFIYLKFINPPKIEKIRYLIQNGYASGIVNQYVGYEDGYISAWYRAAKHSKLTFQFGNKTYTVRGGRTV